MLRPPGKASPALGTCFLSGRGETQAGQTDPTCALRVTSGLLASPFAHSFSHSPVTDSLKHCFFRFLKKLLLWGFRGRRRRSRLGGKLRPPDQRDRSALLPICGAGRPSPPGPPALCHAALCRLALPNFCLKLNLKEENQLEKESRISFLPDFSSSARGGGRGGVACEGVLSLSSRVSWEKVEDGRLDLKPAAHSFFLAETKPQADCA